MAKYDYGTDVECRTCGAEIGKRCRTRDGDETGAHGARQDDHLKKAEETAKEARDARRQRPTDGD
jgi:hypothetical protein